MFKLDFPLKPSAKKIDLSDQVYLSGSCFSNEIGEKMNTYKFQSLANPFGTLYNPISIFKSIKGELDLSHSVSSQGIYYHWDCHGKISGLNKEELGKQVESSLKESANFLQVSNFLILTPGTSFVYKHKESDKVVANCHKIPSENFTKYLLSKNEIVDSFSETYESLKENLTIIFTVSPVRHIKDGLVENSLSKAILIEAVHEMVHSYKNVQYFPAYEIANDELRDYRYFAQDMVHPSAQAIDYIWRRFGDVYFTDETKEFINSWTKILNAINHKAFQPKSKQHQVFLKRTLDDLQALENQVDISKELTSIQNQLL